MIAIAGSCVWGLGMVSFFFFRTLGWSFYRHAIYLFFALSILFLGYHLYHNARYDYQVAHQSEHWDAARNTWKMDYDWRAENRKTGRMDFVNNALLWSVVVHSALCSLLSFARVSEGWLYLLPALLFAVLFVTLTVAWSMASAVGGGGMIG